MIRIPVLALVILAAVTGCHRSASTVADLGLTAPAGTKEHYKAERWARATRGLDFENAGGLVAVDRILAGGALTANAELENADAALAANRVIDALEHYGLAVRHDPDLARGYVGLGLVFKRKGKLDGALAAFRTALDRDDDHPEARYQLGMTLWTLSRHDEAIAEMDALLAADDTFVRAHERRAVWSYYTGDHAAARKHMRRAESLGGRVPAQLAALLDQAAR